jgi:hypothetical protein
VIQPFFNQDGGAGAVGNGPSKQGACNNSAPRAQLIRPCSAGVCYRVLPKAFWVIVEWISVY